MLHRVVRGFYATPHNKEPSGLVDTPMMLPSQGLCVETPVIRESNFH